MYENERDQEEIGRERKKGALEGEWNHFPS